MVATYQILTIVHWLGLAALVVGYGMSMARGVADLVMTWGARIQLVVGLALVAIAEIGQVVPMNHPKIGVKLLVALVVVALCEISRSKAAKGEGRPWLVHAAAGFTLVNVLVATLWN